MAKLLPETEAQRIAATLQVLRLISDGNTVREACEKANISERQYRYWLKSGNEFIDDMRTVIAESERVMLAEVTSARKVALERIIEMAHHSDSLSDLIKADQHLHSIQRELEDRHGAHGVGDDRAKEFVLTGPKLSTAKSRQTINIKPLNDGSLDVTVDKSTDIIDAEFMEEQ